MKSSQNRAHSEPCSPSLLSQRINRQRAVVLVFATSLWLRWQSAPTKGAVMAAWDPAMASETTRVVESPSSEAKDQKRLAPLHLHGYLTMQGVGCEVRSCSRRNCIAADLLAATLRHESCGDVLDCYPDPDRACTARGGNKRHGVGIPVRSRPAEVGT